MVSFFISAAVAASLGTAAAGSEAAATSSFVMPPTAARVLAVHNIERARVGVPALKWDPALAVSAASYGPVLERLGRLQHSPRAGRPGQRENLWMGRRGAFSPEQMVGSWVAEKGRYRHGLFPAVSLTGNWADVAHYTQMVWRGTTHVGCAVHSGARDDFLICRYSPPGNRDGHAAF